MVQYNLIAYTSIHLHNTCVWEKASSLSNSLSSSSSSSYLALCCVYAQYIRRSLIRTVCTSMILLILIFYPRSISTRFERAFIQQQQLQRAPKFSDYHERIQKKIRNKKRGLKIDAKEIINVSYLFLSHELMPKRRNKDDTMAHLYWCWLFFLLLQLDWTNTKYEILRMIRVENKWICRGVKKLSNVKEKWTHGWLCSIGELTKYDALSTRYTFRTGEIQ